MLRQVSYKKRHKRVYTVFLFSWKASESKLSHNTMRYYGEDQYESFSWIKLFLAKFSIKLECMRKAKKKYKYFRGCGARNVVTRRDIIEGYFNWVFFSYPRSLRRGNVHIKKERTAGVLCVPAWTKQVFMLKSLLKFCRTPNERTKC